jgi:glycerol-3-phosphate dehydrogenase (NAD(P)+)
METSSRVVIVGAGELGRAIGVLLQKKSITLEFWDANASLVPDQRPLAELITAASHVLFCVPSWGMRAAVMDALPHLLPDASVFSFAKGIEEHSRQTMAEMMPALLPPAQSLVVVGGPMLAAEIVDGAAAVGVFASKDAAALAWVREFFASEHFRVETTSDMASVALAGVLKNIYAVALGIADGLELSGNEKGWLASRALGEMREIAAALGVNADVVLGTAGAGDFIATGYSVHSRNRETGIEIVATGKCSIRGEGLNSLPSLIERLGKEKAAAFPLLMLINTIGIECQPARPAFDAFFKA